MPVFKSYVDNKGNYIHARPSNTGNITYQTTPEADEFIKKLGYTADDDIPWGLINPLRATGLIYTEGQGSEVNLDDAPELDPSELATMSADEAEKLLSYLQSRGDVPDEIYNQLREVIEVNKDIEKLIDRLDSQTSSSKEVSKSEETNHDDGVVIEIVEWNDGNTFSYQHEIVMNESGNEEYDYSIMKWDIEVSDYYRHETEVEKMAVVHDSQLEIRRVMRSLDVQFFSPLSEFKSTISY